MNLTSKRVIAGLLLAAAFTGVLIKELPWQHDAMKPGSEVLGATETELGQSQVLVQGETQTDVIDMPSSAPEPKQNIPFAGVPVGNGKAFHSDAAADAPSATSAGEIPDPVATVASRNVPVDAPAAFAPFLAQNNPNVPIAGGGAGGGSGGGSSGGNTGGGSSGGNPGGQTPQNPPSDPSSNPNPPVNNPGDNPQPKDPPANPGNDVTTTPPPHGDDPKDPFVPQDPTIDFPNNPSDEPNTPNFPPETPLTPTDVPTDIPNDPVDTPTHSVPDSGSSLALLAIALSGVALATRRVRRT